MLHKDKSNKRQNIEKSASAVGGERPVGYLVAGGLLAVTLCSGAVLGSVTTNATDNTDVVDDVTITVPVSCSMNGTGMDSHTASIENDMPQDIQEMK